MVGLSELLERAEGFQWDEGNRFKNWDKHRVSGGEAEEVFFNQPLLFMEAKGSLSESRVLAMGKTENGRRLAVVFTLRRNLIRVVSVRDMSRKERKFYEEHG